MDEQYMVTCDLSYEVTSWNLQAEKVFGIGCDEALGQPMADLVCAKEFSSACHAIFLEVRNRGAEWEGEMLARRSNKEIFQSAVKISPIRDSKDNLVGLVALGRDISEQELEVHPRKEFSEYLVGERNLTIATAFTYEQGLLRLERFLRKDPAEMTSDDIRHFMRSSSYHPATKASTLNAMKAFHKWGAIEGKWPMNGISALTAPKAPRDPKPALTKAEVGKLLDACRTSNEHRLVYFGLYAGTRISDSAGITKVEFAEDRLRFTSRKSRRGLEIPVHPELAQNRDLILEKSASRSTLKYVCSSLAHYTGIPFTSHALRRTFARTLLDAKVGEGIVIDLLGHAPATVLRGNYAEVSFDEKVEAMSRLSYR